MARRRQKVSIFPLILVIVAIAIFGRIISNRQVIDNFAIIFLVILSTFAILWYLRIRERRRIRAALLAAGTANPMQLTPEQYEQFCATILANNGWSTNLTRKTGDFGADIIAEKKGLKFVIQCKQWSKSVGVKAVQEAHTATSYYRADQALVVTTTGYTKAAKDLAKRTGVRLLSHEDLVNMRPRSK
jgi:restriction system protein